jgi:glycosyltransferase involved in cell wall biosynthesis
LDKYHSVYPRFTLLAEPRIGVSHARNCALNACGSELIAYLDDDCIASSKWIERLMNTLQTSGNNVAAVGGRVRLKFNSVLPVWLSKDLMGFLSELDWGGLRREIGPPMYFVGGNVLYSADAIKKVGGFTTSLGRIGTALLSNEEIELCDRVWSNGFRVIYDPDAVVTHVVSSERLTQEWFRRRVFWQAISDVLIRAVHDGDDRRGAICHPGMRALGIETLSVVDLWSEQHDSESFSKQLRQIYATAAVQATSFRPLQNSSKRRDNTERKKSRL